MKPTPRYIKVEGRLYKKAALQVELIKEQKGPNNQPQKFYKWVKGDTYFVVSYAPGIDETAVFPADKDGNILSYEALGDIGGEDFAGAMQFAGLVVAEVSLPAKIKFKGATYVIDSK